MILLYLIEKEFKQMMRNIILPIVFILLPVGLVNMVPRVATQEVKNLKVAVVDNDHSTTSRRLIEQIGASTYFTLTDYAATCDHAKESVEDRNAEFIVEIAPNFEKTLANEHRCDIAISANGVNGMKAGLGSSYLSAIIAEGLTQMKVCSPATLPSVGTAALPTITPRYLFNTQLDYKIFMVPAILAMLIILIVGFLPALNIVGEKEKGTIEQINVTPISRFDFILSKLIPYWIVGLFILGYAMVLAKLIYGFWPASGVAPIFLFATLFILVVSSFGLVVSNYSNTTQQAALVMFFFLIIFLLMSGLLTPVTSMPDWARAMTTVNPMRHFIEAMRALYLKGCSPLDLLPQMHTLALSAIVMGSWAIASYRKSE